MQQKDVLEPHGYLHPRHHIDAGLQREQAAKERHKNKTLKIPKGISTSFLPSIVEARQMEERKDDQYLFTCKGHREINFSLEIQINLKLEHTHTHTLLCLA